MSTEPNGEMTETQFRALCDAEIVATKLAAKRKHVAELAAIVAGPLLARALEGDHDEESATKTKTLVLHASVNAARYIVALVEKQVTS